LKEDGILTTRSVTQGDLPRPSFVALDGSKEGVIVETRGVTKRFESFTAVSDVNWHLQAGEAAGIIGPNGAGKTTFFNLLTGMFPPSAGTVRFRGNDVTRCSAHERVARGLVRTFQLVSVFDQITVRENLILAIIRFGKDYAQKSRFFFKPCDSRDIVEMCDDALRLVRLEGKATRPTFQLSYGDKRKLEIALALSLRPVILLLDEPFAGLSDGEIAEVLSLIQRVKSNLSLVIIEHKISQIVDLVTRLSVMHEGRLIADGEPREVLSDPIVRQVYWGRA